MTDTIANPAVTTVTVIQDRLWESLVTLARIGAYDEAATGLVGVNQQSLTDADRAGRQLFVSWLEDAGLQVRVDQMGNIFGRRDGSDPGAAPVMAASHIDSVASAGAFDGSLGVLGALEVVRTLNVEQPGLRVETARMAKTNQVPFDADIQAAVAAAADDLGYTHRPLMSGAGHDAQEIAAIAPTAMIFVRGEYDGISHNPRKYSTPEACAHGINVLATTLLRLAGRA